MRAIGLDVHRDFCEIAIVEEARVSSAGRIETTPAAVRAGEALEESAVEPEAPPPSPARRRVP